MLLKQLLESPKTSSNLVVYDPFQELDREELVREVIGLANAEVDGPRNILFGVNAGAVDGNGIVGIPETALADLKKAHRLLSAVVEPVLQLAFVFDRINGKFVGALEIDGCDFGPYFVGHDLSESLSLGQCWVREGYKLLEVERSDLINGINGKAPAPAPAEEPAPLTEIPDIAVGFNEDPESELLEMAVPDTSDPPFAEEDNDVKQPSKLTQVLKDTVGTVTTQILRLGQGADKAIADASRSSSQGDTCEDADKVLTDAKNHYYYEEKALQVNFSVCNQGSVAIKDVSIRLGFPRLPGFDIAERLYTSPFDKRSPAEIRNLGYPDLERRDDAIYVRNTCSVLAPGKAEQVFRCPIRLAVGPEMARRKLAILYKLRGPRGEDLGTGRLKIKFGKVEA